MQFYQKRRENCVKTHVILKKASFYACLTLFAGMAFPMPLWASQSTAIVQQHVKQITGIVNDTSGAPVIGANVVEVGSTNGTITDVDGKFTLNVSVGAKLKVSYIGYNDQQITVGNSNSYTIILKEDTESLDEVVVVGYGTQKKVNLTGSVATISSDKLVNRTSANVTNMLAGQMPGVTIIQNTGQPGADAGDPPAQPDDCCRTSKSPRPMAWGTFFIERLLTDTNPGAEQRRGSLFDLFCREISP